MVDNRGLTVRDIAYYRHPDALTVTTERITRHQYNAVGFLLQSVDPRLFDTGQVNFTYLTSLSGNVLRVQSVDAGSKLALNDTAGRPFIAINNIGTDVHGAEDISQAITHTFQYEDASLPGRQLSVTEQVNGEAARITERFVWAGNTEDEKQYNLVGQCVSHYDTAGNLTQIRHSAPATNNNYTINITISDRSNRGVLSTLTENPAEVDALFTAGGQQNMLLQGQLLTWTPREELQKVSLVIREGRADDNEHYRYAADSQRILKVTQQMMSGSARTQRVQYLPGLELRKTANNDVITEILQVITMGEAGRAQVRLLHWAMGEPPTLHGNNQLRYSYDNLIGSSCLEVDGDGNIISLEEYYPYGGTAVWTARSQIEADYKTIRYSGKERDATGLYYYGYRYYQPWVGRWLSADPAGTVDGLNLFRMVKNNPITLKDERGLNDDEYEIRALANESYKKMSTGSYWKIMHSGISSFNDKPEFDHVSFYYSAMLEDETRTVTNTLEGSRFVEGFKKLDINLVHFTDANLDSNGKATFFSRDKLLSRRIVFDQNHTTELDITILQTTDFAFFSLDIGENGKSNSRFGKNKYEIPIKKIADNGYLRESFFAMNYTLYWNKIIPEQWPDAEQASLMKRMATIFNTHDVDNLMQLKLGDFPEETVFSYGEHLNQLAIRMLWPMVAYNSNMSTKGRNTILNTTTPDEYGSLLSILYRVQVLVPVKLETEHFSKK